MELVIERADLVTRFDPRPGKRSGVVTRKYRSNAQLFVDRSGSFGSLALPFRGRVRRRPAAP